MDVAAVAAVVASGRTAALTVTLPEAAVTVTARSPAPRDSHVTSIHASPEMVGSAVTADVHAVTHEAMWMVVGAAAQVDDAGSERSRRGSR